MQQYEKEKTQSPNTSEYVCVIGAANVDIVGFPNEPLRYKDDNIGRMNISMGGVGRNIAENLVRLGLRTKLICPLGDDVLSKQIIAHCKQTGIDIKDSLFLSDETASVHTSIMDSDNDLALGISDMTICDKMSDDFISSKKKIIANAEIVVLETNIPTPVLTQIVKDNPNKKYFLDTVSGSQCIRANDILDKVFILKTNQLEAELLSKIKILNENNYSLVAESFHEKGVAHVFITLGARGVYYSNGVNDKIVAPKKTKIVNANGAGDAFSAGVIYGFVKKCPVLKWTEFGLSCAESATMHADTVNPNLNIHVFNDII